MLHKKFCIIFLSIPLLSGCHLINTTQANNEKNIASQTADLKSSSDEGENKTGFPPLSEGENVWQQLSYMEKRDLNCFLTLFTFVGLEKFDNHRYFEEEIARFATQHFRGQIPERFPYYIGKSSDDLYQIPISEMDDFIARTFGIQRRKDTFPFLEKDNDQFDFKWDDPLLSPKSTLPSGSAQVTDVHKNNDGTFTVSFDVYQYDGTQVMIAPPEGRENPSEDSERYYSYSGKALLQKQVEGDTKYYQLCQYSILTPKEQIKTPIQQQFIPTSPEEAYFNEMNYLNELKKEIATVSDEAIKRKLYEMRRSGMQEEFGKITKAIFYKNPLDTGSNAITYDQFLRMNTSLIQGFQYQMLDKTDHPKSEDPISKPSSNNGDTKKTPSEDQTPKNQIMAKKIALKNDYEIPEIPEIPEISEIMKEERRKSGEWYKISDFPLNYDAFLKSDYGALPYPEYSKKMDKVIEAYESSTRAFIHTYFISLEDVEVPLEN